MKINLIKVANYLYEELKNNGIRFNSAGFPVFPGEIILKDVPDEIIPFSKRKNAADKKGPWFVFSRKMIIFIES